MTYRISSIDVPAEAPFQYDALERREVVEFLAGLIGRTGGPFVMALDSPWGTGKTSLIQMLAAVLRNDGYQCLHFNAWQVDYVNDPLVALVSVISQLSLPPGPSSRFKKHLETVRKIASAVAKRTAVAGVKAVTLGTLDIKEDIETVVAEMAGELSGDLIAAFEKETELLSTFRTELEAAVVQIAQGGQKPTLVIFIDELDRCRPTFSIELLERVKHLFDVANIVFVLAVDKQQLEASISAVYGSINAAEYLRRFIDLEFGIPKPAGDKFISVLLSKFQLDDFFRNRPSEFANDRKNFVRFFAILSDVVGMSLRAQERAVTLLKIVLDQTQKRAPLDAALVATLIVLRIKEPVLFRRLHHGEASSDDVMSYLRALPGMPRLKSERVSLVLEAYLIATDPNHVRKGLKEAEIVKIFESPDSSHDDKKWAENMLPLLRSISGPMNDPPNLRDIAAKIDLAANIRG